MIPSPPPVPSLLTDGAIGGSLRNTESAYTGSSSADNGHVRQRARKQFNLAHYDWNSSITQFENPPNDILWGEKRSGKSTLITRLLMELQPNQILYYWGSIGGKKAANERVLPCYSVRWGYDIDGKPTESIDDNMGLQHLRKVLHDQTEMSLFFADTHQQQYDYTVWAVLDDIAKDKKFMNSAVAREMATQIRHSNFGYWKLCHKVTQVPTIERDNHDRSFMFAPGRISQYRTLYTELCDNAFDCFDDFVDLVQQYTTGQNNKGCVVYDFSERAGDANVSFTHINPRISDVRNEPKGLLGAPWCFEVCAQNCRRKYVEALTAGRRVIPPEPLIPFPKLRWLMPAASRMSMLAATTTTTTTTGPSAMPAIVTRPSPLMSQNAQLHAYSAVPPSPSQNLYVSLPAGVAATIPQHPTTYYHGPSATTNSTSPNPHHDYYPSTSTTLLPPPTASRAATPFSSTATRYTQSWAPSPPPSAPVSASIYRASYPSSLSHVPHMTMPSSSTILSSPSSYPPHLYAGTIPPAPIVVAYNVPTAPPISAWHKAYEEQKHGIVHAPSHSVRDVLDHRIRFPADVDWSSVAPGYRDPADRKSEMDYHGDRVDDMYTTPSIPSDFVRSRMISSRKPPPMTVYDDPRLRIH